MNAGILEIQSLSQCKSITRKRTSVGTRAEEISNRHLFPYRNGCRCNLTQYANKDFYSTLTLFPNLEIAKKQLIGYLDKTRFKSTKSEYEDRTVQKYPHKSTITGKKQLRKASVFAAPKRKVARSNRVWNRQKKSRISNRNHVTFSLF